MKFGFISGRSGGLNVRKAPDINSKIVHVLRPTAREFCVWDESKKTEDWQSIAIYLNSGALREGWVHTGYWAATAFDVPQTEALKHVYDINIPTFPTIVLTEDERIKLLKTLNWLVAVIETAPMDWDSSTEASALDFIYGFIKQLIG